MQTNGSVRFERTFFLPDLHAPFHDRDAYELALRSCEAFKPHRIVVMGDFGDFYFCNMHGKNPYVRSDPMWEINTCSELLRALEGRFLKVPLVYVQGNHEDRLARFVARNALDLWGTVRTWDEMLGIANHRRWEIVPYGGRQGWKLPHSHLMVRHAPIRRGAYAARRSATEGGVNLMYADAHHIQIAHHTKANGEQIMAMGCGWLGDVHHPVFNYHPGVHQWALGFATAVVDTVDGQFWANVHPIIESDKTYRVRIGDAVKEIKRGSNG